MPACQKLYPKVRTDTTFQQAERALIAVQASRFRTVFDAHRVKVEQIPAASSEQPPQRDFREDPVVGGIIVGFGRIQQVGQRLVLHGSATRCLLRNSSAE